MAAAAWVAPVVGLGVIGGGLALLRHFNTTVKENDYVVFPFSAIPIPVQLPGQPSNAPFILRVDEVTPQGLRGYAVGWLDQGGNPAFPGGDAAWIQLPVPIPKSAVTRIYRFRNNALQRVT